MKNLRSTTRVPQAAHTPGPWLVIQPQQIHGTEEWQGLMILDASRSTIAEVFSVDHGDAQANARLFAAAPDLLEAAAETQEDISDVRQLATKLVDSRNRSLTGTEAERVAHLLRYLDRISRVSRAAIAKVTE